MFENERCFSKLFVKLGVDKIDRYHKNGLYTLYEWTIYGYTENVISTTY